PASALINTGNQAQVYVVKNGKAVLQNITVANKIQNNAVISNGLNVGDVIVTNGFINLFDGANVLITN
nr:efflux RND transporter periplasmic adaptor subunit [Bacteroidia bacterium]